jgi:hypothetical protein
VKPDGLRCSSDVFAQQRIGDGDIAMPETPRVAEHLLVALIRGAFPRLGALSRQASHVMG